MTRPRAASLAIELTAHCNQKCAYCYNAWREDGGAAVGAPEPSTLLARADKFLDAVDVDYVTLTGGEPFAHREALGLITHLRARGVTLQIISNGGLIDDRLAHKLAALSVSQIQITLNGPDKTLHEEHVGEGHFDRTIAGIRALVARGVHVVGCIVVTRKNAHKVGETLALFQSLGVRSIALSRFSPAGYATRHAAALLCSRDDLTKAFEQAHPFAEAGMTITVTMPVPPCAVEVERFDKLGFGTCPIGTEGQQFALSPDGKLKNCTLHQTALGGVGDILDPTVDVATLLTAPEVTQYRRRLPAFCEGCTHASTCGGGCGAAAEWVSGDARGFPDPFVWQHIDDDLAARFALERGARSPAGKVHLEVIA